MIKKGQLATLQKNDLNIRYLWEQELSENQLKRKKKYKSLCSATKIEAKHSRQVEIATFICNLIMGDLDCIEDNTTEYLRFLPQAKDVVKGIVWN